MPTDDLPGLTRAAGADVAAALGRAGSGNPLLGIGIDPQAGMPADRLCLPGGGGGGGGDGGNCGDDSVGDSGAGNCAGDRGDDCGGNSGGDGGRLNGTAADVIDRVAARLGGCERRVAASMVVLGYSARLVGPAVSVLLREDMLLDLRPSNVRFAYDPRLGFSLDLVRPAAWRGDRAALRTGWCQVVIDEHLRLVIEAVQAVVPVAAGLLWGNVASGLAGALRAVQSGGTISGRAAAVRGVSVSRCYAEGRYLLDHGPLRGSGDLAVRSGALSFVRRSCCLYYRLDGGGMCGDCALLQTPGPG